MMRFLVCCGIERAAAELFRAAETVPGVSPRCCAMVLSVTLFSWRWPGFFLGGGVIYRFSAQLPKLGYGKWCAQARKLRSARFTRRPVSRDFSSTCVLLNIISTQQAGIEFRPGIIQNLDNGIAKLGPPRLPGSHSRITLLFCRISLFLLDKPGRMVLNTQLVQKHYV